MTEAKRGRSVNRHPQAKRGFRKILLDLFPMIVVLIIVTISLVVLSMWKISPEVEIALKVSQFSFRSKDDQPSSMFNSVRTNTLRLSNYEELNLGNGRLELAINTSHQTRDTVQWKVQAAQSISSIIRPQRSFATLSLKDITINSLRFAPGSQIIFSQKEDGPNSLLLITDGDITGEIVAGKLLSFTCSNCNINDTSSDSGSKRLRLTAENGPGNTLTFSGKKPTVIGLVLPDTENLKGQNIKLENELDFTQMEEGRQVSTISEGKITFADLKKEIAIKEGEFISLDYLKDFRIQSVNINKGINITFHGIAGKLESGSGGYLKDKRPSAFEYVLAQEIWVLLLQGLAVLMGSAWTIFSFIKSNRNE